MRLWHEALIDKLPRQQLLGQHRECCALRGNSWLKPHSVINYIFDYTPYHLFLYHELIMNEMKKRGYNVEPLWYDPFYRGKIALPWHVEQLGDTSLAYDENKTSIYAEHDEHYLQECIENLNGKGIHISIDS